MISRLRESHQEGVYDSIERLVRAGEAVGLSVDNLIHMLDRGMTLAELLDLIEARMMAGAGLTRAA
jgi:hypothetical protein